MKIKTVILSAFLLLAFASQASAGPRKKQKQARLKKKMAKVAQAVTAEDRAKAMSYLKAAGGGASEAGDDGGSVVCNTMINGNLVALAAIDTSTGIIAYAGATMSGEDVVFTGYGFQGVLTGTEKGFQLVDGFGGMFDGGVIPNDPENAMINWFKFLDEGSPSAGRGLWAGKTSMGGLQVFLQDDGIVRPVIPYITTVTLRRTIRAEIS